MPMRRDRRSLPRAGRPPRRGTDRAEDAVAFLLAFGLLVLLVVAAVFGFSVRDQVSEQSRVETAARSQVDAVVLDGAPVVTDVAGGASMPVQVSARWTGPNGAEHTGLVSTVSLPAVGTTLPVWIERDGTITGPPTRPGDAVVAGVLTGFGVVLLGAMVLAGAWVGVRRITAALNAARWTQEWAQVEPEWSRHLR
jgi:hypothetical protein